MNSKFLPLLFGIFAGGLFLFASVPDGLTLTPSWQCAPSAVSMFFTVSDDGFGGGQGRGGIEPEPIPPLTSTEQTPRRNCSTNSQGDCSTSSTVSRCSTQGQGIFCSSDVGNGPSGRCSVVTGGGSGDDCSALTAGTCSTQGSGTGKGACSATGQAWCSAMPGTGATCSTHGTGDHQNCSVTEGEGGTCTVALTIRDTACCSTQNTSGEGHCSSWNSDGEPVDSGERCLGY